MEKEIYEKCNAYTFQNILINERRDDEIGNENRECKWEQVVMIEVRITWGL